MFAGGSAELRASALGEMIEGSDGSEVWTAEMASQAEARMNGRMGKLEEGMASVGDRLAGLETLLRRVAAATPPQPSARSSGFFGAPGSELKA